jgi:hypothetical protein
MKMTNYRTFINEGDDVDKFVKEINKLKNANKNGWYTWVGNINGKDVKIKGYGTWLQVYKVDGIDYSNPMEQSVKDYKLSLKRPFNEGTVSADIAQGSGEMKGKKDIYKKCMNTEGDCIKDLDESPVGSVGRTSDYEAGEFIDGTPELRAEFKKIVKKVGGVSVARRLLNSKLFGINESPVGQIGRTGYMDAENHLQSNPELIKRFKKIIKELGGLTATRKLLLQLGGLGQLAGGVPGIGDQPQGSIQETTQNILSLLEVLENEF